MPYTNEFRNFYSNLSLNNGFSDLLFIVRDEFYEPDFAFNPIALDYKYVVQPASLTLNTEQSSELDKRLAGEGPLPNTFSIAKQTLKLSMDLPIRANISGFVENGFASLWDFAVHGYMGTKTGAISSVEPVVSSSIIAIGTTQLIIKNMVEFLPFTLPKQVTLASFDNSEANENVIITNIDRNTRTVTFQSPTTIQRTTSKTFIVGRDQYVDKDPTFSLLSLREGLISNCAVSKISLNITSENDLSANIDIESSFINRNPQTYLYSNFETLQNNIRKIPGTRVIHGSNTRLNYISANPGTFGLALPLDDKFFNGFQGLSISSFLVKEIDITLENNLEELYCQPSVNPSRLSRQRYNAHPIAFSCNGQKLSGSIKYISPLAPHTFAEIMSGSSSVNNGGIEINCGDFKLTLRELAWSVGESSMDSSGQIIKTVKFSLLSENFTTLPILEYSNNY